MLLVLASLLAEPGQATRIACIGSNGERELAKASIVAQDANAMPLKAVLRTAFQQPGIEFNEFTPLHPDDDRRFVEYQLIDWNGGLTVTTEQADGSPEAGITLERSCLSPTADGWEAAWQKLVNALKGAGYRVES